MCSRFAKHFKTRAHDQYPTAEQYLKGLMQASRKNMERIEEVVPESEWQSLQHFITYSPWNERAVINQVAQEADALLGGGEGSCLLIDESGFGKKGTKSVGVGRQWNGRLGKVDNCQVAVFAALASRDRVTPVDTRLYLPKDWTKDKIRCKEAGIPEEKMVFKSKPALAVEMVKQARELGLRYEWVSADGLYGNNPEFCRVLDDMEEQFMVDVHKDQRIYLEDPKPEWCAQEDRSDSGKLKATSLPIRVDKWAKQQEKHAWKLVELRDTTKGKLIVEVLHQRVWLWDGKEDSGRQWHLLVRRDKGTESEYKYGLSNASADTSADRLAYMQGQRYWIERTFEDAKSECGMADYQIRGWRAWHHHMALVMMAMLFMLEERMVQKESVPLLSCSDIETLLAHFLPRRDISEEEVLRQLEVRHAKRQASIDSAYKMQDISMKKRRKRPKK